jgi:hypothetical protein
VVPEILSDNNLLYHSRFVGITSSMARPHFVGARDTTW